jgi:hypothetical protein
MQRARRYAGLVIVMIHWFESTASSGGDMRCSQITSVQFVTQN